MKPFALPERLLGTREFFGKLGVNDLVEASVRARFLIDELEQCHRWLWRVGLVPAENFEFPTELQVLQSLTWSALHLSGGDRKAAAKLLGINPKTLRERLRVERVSAWRTSPRAPGKSQ